ncbi:hypothetical protein B7H23_02565 [Notoacmeibacter marinus]|uniref:GmrSD restriction endonucleases N-terminal domain-containing protein n=1 Tax=Notoacmeibacter marinus TaxID=1876515 RepID=A0A231V1D3_9HYPH|nr:DUF262 domain-containing protein [Notoacmeibacter marinus]OXT01851.1 hypothetical protein B7H23_02565 [Notoacmeibacter marinus]
MKQWDIQQTTYTIGDFLSWKRSKSLILSPSFQRRSVWKPVQKSYLIDTLYRGMPVPIIFLREQTDIDSLATIREVVDGQQRLRTIISYVDIDLLDDVETSDYFTVLKKHNTELANRKFSDLREGQRKSLLSYKFSVHVLPLDTSDADVLGVFARMNSTGSKLNDQELRNAEFFGDFKEASYGISYDQLGRWREWRVFSENDIARMLEVEFTSILLMYLSQGIFEQTKKNIDDFYRKNDDKYKDGDDHIELFYEIMDIIDRNFGRSIDSSSISNKNMFFHLFVLIDRLIKSNIEITPARVREIFRLFERLNRREDLPSKVAIATETRFNRKSNRQEVSNFLFENVA